MDLTADDLSYISCDDFDDDTIAPKRRKIQDQEEEHSTRGRKQGNRLYVDMSIYDGINSISDDSVPANIDGTCVYDVPLKKDLKVARVVDHWVY